MRGSVNVSRRGALRGLGALTLAACGLRANAAQAQRLVCVGGALTEMVYALGAEALLAGVDTTSLFPAPARRLPSVGYTRALSAEGVLSLAPTQLLATEDAGPPAVLRQIAAAGVPVTVLAANHRFEGMLDRLQRIGEITAQPQRAAALAQQSKEAWARAQAQVAANASKRSGKPPRVLFVLAHSMSQVMVAGSGTSAQAMLDYAGAVNAVQGHAGFKPLTPEAAIGAAPDVILATSQGLESAGGAAGLLSLPGLGQTPAGRAQRVIAMEAMLLLGFGPRMPQALSELDVALASAMPA